jgi:hypothetical protein
MTATKVPPPFPASVRVGTATRREMRTNAHAHRPELSRGLDD